MPRYLIESSLYSIAWDWSVHLEICTIYNPYCFLHHIQPRFRHQFLLYMINRNIVSRVKSLLLFKATIVNMNTNVEREFIAIAIVVHFYSISSCRSILFCQCICNIMVAYGSIIQYHIIFIMVFQKV